MLNFYKINLISLEIKDVSFKVFAEEVVKKG